ncbi:phosphoenolpyruvate synthase [Vibrio profundum]|uniref:putative PEP-binding protein n=1 Tax=Vibrio profundum TaxID=2910247 RepID=UPI003D112A6A
MSVEPQALNQADTLPAGPCNQIDNQCLYVSLFDLVQHHLGFHPALSYEQVYDIEALRPFLNEFTPGSDWAIYVADKLVGEMASAVTEQYKRIRICLSDADSTAYSALVGDGQKSSHVNPAMGERGVVRYSSYSHHQVLEIECAVVKKVRQLYPDLEVDITVPFVRTQSDAAMMIDRLAEYGLARGVDGLKVHFSIDVPSSALLAHKLLHYFDGISINVSHLAQFTLGLASDNTKVAHLVDPENEAVLALLDMALTASLNAGKPVTVVSTSLSFHQNYRDRLVHPHEHQILHVTM